MGSVGLGRLNELGAAHETRGVNGRLTAWLALVFALAGLNYAARFTSGKPAKNVLYQWGTAVGSLVIFALILIVVLLIARGAPGLLAWRRPRSWKRAVRIAPGVLIGVYVVAGVLSPLLHPGREQGLTPSGWQPAHAGAFAANALVVCGLAPFVEETTFRGAGFALISARWGNAAAIGATAVLFGLAHGLVEALPVLVAFGLGLAWLRHRVGSTIPGMILHGTFNALALVFSLAI